MLILDNDEVDSLLDMGECISVLEAAYADLAAGRAANSVRGENLAPCGRDDAHYLFKHMGGTWPARGIHALRINSEILSYGQVDGRPRRRKLPLAPGQRWVGLVQIYSIDSGALLALFPDGVTQRMRVGASSGIALARLARPDATRVGLIGSGWQAGAQVLAAAAVRPLEAVKVYSPNAANRDAFAAEMRERLGIAVQAVDSPAACARDVDCLLAATSSLVRVIDPDWLVPGMHVGCIRSEELDEAVTRRCDQVVLHVKDDRQAEAVALPGTPGLDSHHRNFAGQHGGGGLSGWPNWADLAELVAQPDRRPRAPHAITCFINNVGLGVQFAALGALLLERAQARGLGRALPDEWFTQSVHP